MYHSGIDTVCDEAIEYTAKILDGYFESIRAYGSNYHMLLGAAICMRKAIELAGAFYLRFCCEMKEPILMGDRTINTLYTMKLPGAKKVADCLNQHLGGLNRIIHYQGCQPAVLKDADPEKAALQLEKDDLKKDHESLRVTIIPGFFRCIRQVILDTPVLHSYIIAHLDSLPNLACLFTEIGNGSDESMAIRDLDYRYKLNDVLNGIESIYTKGNCDAWYQWHAAMIPLMVEEAGKSLCWNDCLFLTARKTAERNLFIYALRNHSGQVMAKFQSTKQGKEMLELYIQALDHIMLPDQAARNKKRNLAFYAGTVQNHTNPHCHWNNSDRPFLSDYSEDERITRQNSIAAVTASVKEIAWIADPRNDRGPGVAPPPQSPERAALLNHCRQMLRFFAGRAGIEDFQRDIDSRLFCTLFKQEVKADSHAIARVPVRLDDTIRSLSRNILIQAGGGMGKTHLILYTMNQLLESGRPCAYIPCLSFSDEKENHEGILFSKYESLYTANLHLSLKNLSDVFSCYIVDSIPEPFILFLDGFNEAVNHTVLAADIHKIVTEFPGIRIVISSRSTDPVFSSFFRLEMDGLTEETVDTLLKDNMQVSYASLNPNLQRILLTPMFLHLFLTMKGSAREIHSGAELMDNLREKTLADAGGRKDYPLIEQTMKELFPGFAVSDYTGSRHSLDFTGEALKSYLLENGLDQQDAGEAIAFLKINHIILDAHNARFIYQHEHFRDYWVAEGLINQINAGKAGSSAAVSSDVVLDVFGDTYSDQVLQNLSDLTADSGKNALLLECLRSLKKSSMPDEPLWAGRKTARATQRIMELIIRLSPDKNISGMDLSELNLSATELNGVITSRHMNRCDFTGCLISSRTFLSYAHEGAPRRAVPVTVGSRRYYASVSDFDLMLSDLSGSSIEPVYRIGHNDGTGHTVHIRTIQSLSSLGSHLMATDSEHHTFLWHFVPDSGGIACETRRSGLPIEQVFTDRKTVRVISCRDDRCRPILAVLFSDGEIVQFAETDSCLEEACEPILLDRPVDMNLTFTYSSRIQSFYWACTEKGTTTVYGYNLSSQRSRIIAEIPTEDMKADLMECGPSGKTVPADSGPEDNPGRTDPDAETFLFLTCCTDAKTALYQIPLPCVHSPSPYWRLSWDISGRTDCLQTDTINVRRPLCRIHAIRFRDQEMILCANSGNIYHFYQENPELPYVVSSLSAVVPVSDSRFAIDDIVYTDNGQVLAMCVDRSLLLLDGSHFLKLDQLDGSNDGIRSIYALSNKQFLATAYDGCLLLLRWNRSGERMVCWHKQYIGFWCWSAASFDRQYILVGFLGGLRLFDLESQEIVWKVNYPGKKIEQLHACGELVFSAEHEDERVYSEETRVCVYRLAHHHGQCEVENEGTITALNGKFCFSFYSDDERILFGCNDFGKKNPGIYMYRRGPDLNAQEPVVIPFPLSYGHVEDIRVAKNLMAACGSSEQEGGGESSVVYLWDVSDFDHPRLITPPVRGFTDYISHCPLFVDPEGGWRMALIDASRTGSLYEYRIMENQNGTLQYTRLCQLKNDRILSDVMFDSLGNLLVSSLGGDLYYQQWGSGEWQSRFQNKNQMLTYSTGFTSLYNAVSENEPLGRVLLDFSNTLGNSGEHRERRRL